MLLANRRTRASVEAMRKAAEVLGVEAPKSRGPKVDQELLGALRLEVNRRLEGLAEDEHVKCAVCGEVATDDTEFCPFCGDEGSLSEEAAAAADVGPDEDEVETEADDDESDDEESDDEESDDEESDDDESDDDESDDEESDDDTTAKVVDPTDDSSVGIAEGAGKITKSVPAALKTMERQLTVAIDKIVELKHSAVGLSYDIGLQCKEIRDKQLFKARGYRSFKEFADKELPFTRESAIQLISIVEKHSREDYAEIGYAKLRVIAAVSDTAVKEELITAAREGASTRQIAEKATASVVEPPPPTASGNSKTAPTAEKGERITLLGRVGGKKQVVRFHNSATGEIIPNVGVFTKKGFVPSAYSELEISSGVFLRIGLRIGANYELEGMTVRFIRAGG